MKVFFENVGRDKRNWSAECKKDLDYDWLYSQVKSKLLSSDIDFYLDRNDDHKGIIVVGGFREVGSFRIE